jgi:hypothetical protein
VVGSWLWVWGEGWDGKYLTPITHPKPTTHNPPLTLKNYIFGYFFGIRISELDIFLLPPH